MFSTAVNIVLATVASILWVGAALGIIAFMIWFVLSSERWFTDGNAELQAMESGQAKSSIGRTVVCHVKQVPFVIFFMIGAYLAISAIMSLFKKD